MARDLLVARWLTGGVLALLVASASPASESVDQAHLPTLECWNTGALRVTCQGTIPAGTPASSITVRVFDKDGQLVHVGHPDSGGRVTFRKPDAQFHVVFDAGHGNVLTLLAAGVT